MLITDAAVKNKTTVLVLIVLIIVMGTYSYVVLPREGTPDVPIPYVLVSTPYEGVSPEDMETSVTLKIEQELSGIKGMKEVRSVSAEGISMVIVEFEPDVVIDDALQYVRARVDLAKKDLPQDAEEPTVQEINIADFPIIIMGISGDISSVSLKAIADELEDELELVPGVLNVNVIGAVEREIRIEMDPDRVAMYNLTIPELIALIPSENVNISVGGLETEGTRFFIRIPAEFDDPAEVNRLLLTVRDGHPIYLSDVATIRDTFKDRTSYSRLDGQPSITLAIQKRVGANVVAIADHVKVIVDEARRQAPQGVRFDVTFDMSKYIRDIVRDLENNIASGLLLVLLVLVLFMGIRASAIVALAIPLSMCISFVVIQAIGFTLNMIVLFSLILALGMLVDNAIVIVENIYRHRQLGYNRMEAAILGAREVAWPITTSTLTTLAAFFPLTFWPGIMGDFMKYLPITLIITLSSSLFVALVINPTICAMVGGEAPPVHPKKNWFIRGYAWLLRAALHHRPSTLILALLLLVCTTIYFGKFNHGIELFPTTDPDRAMINIRFPQGTNVKETDRLARIVEERLGPYREEIKNVVTNVGSAEGGISFNLTPGAGSGGEHSGDITLVFPDFEVREIPSEDVIKKVRESLVNLAGAEIKVEKEKEGPPTGAAVTIEIIGKDFEVLASLSDQIRNRISGVSGLVNLRSDYESTRPELAFRVDRRRAVMLGVNTSVIGEFLKMAVFGREVGKYRQFNDEYDITLRLPVSQRMNIEDILRLRVPNAFGRAVPLSSLGTFEYSGGFGTINRVSQKRVVTLTGNAEGRLGSEVLKDVEENMKGLDIPAGYEIRFAGEKEEQDKAMAFLSKAFIVALLLIVMILVAQFNSLAVPMIIMTTVLLSLFGVMAGLQICNLPFGVIMTGVGVISLAGVVVNNAIVLLAYTRQLEGEGKSLEEATCEAGETRLRPVLLTAATTIIGLIPMAVGVSYDFHIMEWASRSHSSQWWRSMAVVVIFGLAFATVLTLVVVPTLYVSLMSMSHSTSRFLKKVFVRGFDKPRSDMTKY
jgi:multidrug efflux pump subunit AcrB